MTDLARGFLSWPMSEGVQPWLPPEYISGLNIEWISISSVRVKTGVCNTAAGHVLMLPSDFTIVGIPANTGFGYIYLSPSPSGAFAEYSTTAPTSPYWGSARSKPGEPSKRFLGSVVGSNTGSGLWCQLRDEKTNEVWYEENLNTSAFQLLIAGQATVYTSVSTTALAPPTATQIMVQLYNSSNNSSTGTAFLADGIMNGIGALSGSSSSNGTVFCAGPGGNTLGFKAVINNGSMANSVGSGQNIAHDEQRPLLPDSWFDASVACFRR